MGIVLLSCQTDLSAYFMQPCFPSLMLCVWASWNELVGTWSLFCTGTSGEYITFIAIDSPPGVPMRKEPHAPSWSWQVYLSTFTVSLPFWLCCSNYESKPMAGVNLWVNVFMFPGIQCLCAYQQWHPCVYSFFIPASGIFPPNLVQ